MPVQICASLVLGCLLFLTVRPAKAAPPEPDRKLVLQMPPAISVNSIAVSPTGALVATASGEGGVRLYDAQSGNLTRVLGAVGDRSVVFSPDGRFLAAAGFHMDKIVGVFDVQTGRRVLSLLGQQEWEADATAFSPDGKLLASTATDKQILIWDLTTGKLVHQLTDQPARLPAMAFSPDSATLAVGGTDRIVRLLDTKSGKIRGSLSGHSDVICTLAFSPDGQQLASGSCDWGFHRGHNWPRAAGRGPERCEWRLWDVARQKQLRQETSEGPVLSLAFSPDGQQLACAIGSNVRLFDLKNPASTDVFTTHHAGVTTVAFSPDGKAILSGSHDQTVRRTNVQTKRTEWEAPGWFEQVNSVAMSADRSLLVTGSSDHRFAWGKLRAQAEYAGTGAVRLWDIKTTRLLHSLGGSREQIMAVAISPNGKLIAAGGASPSGRGVVRLWEAGSGKELSAQVDHQREVLALAFSADGARLASGSADGMVHVYATQSGELVREMPGHQGGVTGIAFSPDNTQVHCAEGYGGVRTWPLSGGAAYACPGVDARAKTYANDRLMNSLGLTADGKLLATCASSVNNEFVDSVKLWDAGTGKLHRDFAAENIHGRPMALSPDGSLVATGGKSVKLWDTKSGEKIRELFGHLKRTQSIAFSADGRLIAAGGSYGSTNLWEVATGEHLMTLFGFGRDLATGANPNHNEEPWLAYTNGGYFTGSAGAEKYIAWRIGDTLETSASAIQEFRQPAKLRQQ